MHLPIKMMREDKSFPSKKEFTDHVKLIKTASLNSLDGFAFGKMQMCYVLVFFCFSAFKVFKNSLTQEVSAFFYQLQYGVEKGLHVVQDNGHLIVFILGGHRVFQTKSCSYLINHLRT